MILRLVKLQRMPAELREIQIESWCAQGDITRKEEQELIEIVREWE